MNKLPLLLLIIGAIFCLASIGLQRYGDAQGTAINTIPFTIAGVILVALGAYLNTRKNSSE